MGIIHVKILLLSLLGVLLLNLTGCATQDQSIAVVQYSEPAKLLIFRKNRSHETDVRNLASGANLQDIPVNLVPVQEAHIFAAFSENVYHEKCEPGHPRVTEMLKTVGWDKLPGFRVSTEGCSTKKTPEGYQPKSSESVCLIPDYLTESFLAPDLAIMVPGLAFDVWYETSENPAEAGPVPQRIAIVFEGSNMQRGDWFTNLRFLSQLVPFWWDQYDQVRSVIDEVIQEIESLDQFAGKELEFVAAGHSLGGGLAQVASYQTSKIKLVYAIDSSPRTGYFDIVGGRNVRDYNTDGQMNFRIHEKGEFLEPVRAAWHRIFGYQPDKPQAVGIRYDFNRWRGLRNTVSNHCVGALACQLNLLAEQTEYQSNMQELDVEAIRACNFGCKPEERQRVADEMSGCSIDRRARDDD